MHAVPRREREEGEGGGGEQDEEEKRGERRRGGKRRKSNGMVMRWQASAERQRASQHEHVAVTPTTHIPHLKSEA